MRWYSEYKSLQSFANALARKHGYGFATQIILGEKNEVVQHTSFGYRKYTTGEYVANAYLANFGWKNTYYQHAETVVSVTPDIMSYFYEEKTDETKEG